MIAQWTAGLIAAASALGFVGSDDSDLSADEFSSPLELVVPLPADSPEPAAPQLVPPPPATATAGATPEVVPLPVTAPMASISAAPEVAPHETAHLTNPAMVGVAPITISAPSFVNPGCGSHCMGLTGRDPEAYFDRRLSVPPIQMFLPSYYNPYVSRNQRFIPYSCFGPGEDLSPYHPYAQTTSTTPRVPVPMFSGKVDAKPLSSGAVMGSGMSR